MSVQSWVLAIVLSLIAVLVIVSWIIYKTWSLGGTVSLILYLLFVAITTYDTECLVEGKCIIWSWIRSVIYMIIPVIIIIIYLYALAASSKSKNAIEQEAKRK